mmetsp:Transcript_6100/g.14692  ORF Transcript_6100/g.14692 Transcript_6100/m.14692 type:complete len:250 (+) Transcript_6100:979-1728(+)
MQHPRGPANDLLTGISHRFAESIGSKDYGIVICPRNFRHLLNGRPMAAVVLLLVKPRVGVNNEKCTIQSVQSRLDRGGLARHELGDDGSVFFNGPSSHVQNGPLGVLVVEVSCLLELLIDVLDRSVVVRPLVHPDRVCVHTCSLEPGCPDPLQKHGLNRQPNHRPWIHVKDFLRRRQAEDKGDVCDLVAILLSEVHAQWRLGAPTDAQENHIRLDQVAGQGSIVLLDGELHRLDTLEILSAQGLPDRPS